jgi:hypothetical protein
MINSSGEAVAHAPNIQLAGEGARKLVVTTTQARLRSLKAMEMNMTHKTGNGARLRPADSGNGAGLLLHMQPQALEGMWHCPAELTSSQSAGLYTK